MTQKRFESRQSINKTGYVVIDNEKQYTFPVMSEDDCYMFCKVLNALHEENTEYKQEFDNIYFLIGRGDWSGLVDLLTDDEKSKTK